jgi:hypothetical protein
VRVERDSGMCVARDLYELWGRSTYTRMFVCPHVALEVEDHLMLFTIRRRSQVSLFLAAAHIALQEVGESPPNTWRSLSSLNDDPLLCATLYTDDGVGELYQRRTATVTLCRPSPHQDWG